MTALGVAVVVGRQVSGWRAGAPLLAAACILVLVPLYSIDPYLHVILLGVWDIPWLVIGLTVFSAASRRIHGEGTSRRTAPDWRAEPTRDGGAS